MSATDQERAADRRELESEFELAVVDVLEQDHDLEVRLPDDSWNRRKNCVATLHFKYHWDRHEPRAKVVVMIEGKRDTSNVMLVDFSSPEAIETSAEDCESLALNVHVYLEACREQAHTETKRGRHPRQRWDD
jgi:hypothetical protein